MIPCWKHFKFHFHLHFLLQNELWTPRSYCCFFVMWAHILQLKCNWVYYDVAIGPYKIVMYGVLIRECEETCLCLWGYLAVVIAMVPILWGPPTSTNHQAPGSFWVCEHKGIDVDLLVFRLKVLTWCKAKSSCMRIMVINPVIRGL